MRLGAVEAGRYQRAEGIEGEQWAFDKIKDMWQEEVASDSSEDDGDSNINGDDGRTDEAGGAHVRFDRNVNTTIGTAPTRADGESIGATGNDATASIREPPQR